ncbi:MAG: double-strand break repair helicase AddA [Rhodobacteraceae bacterium]|nr:double-strand break repair helicase AddA [Paracoccaceae bacterium]
MTAAADAIALASARQMLAADPRASVWVSANAGSGKTKVLTDRVARLLLGGAAPERILCLTYTKAAAAEMQNRLFRRLGAWAMLEDGALRAELEALGGPVPGGAAALRAARRLFARAIDAPGGLKIQTIHAFCAGLLRRFPLEAGVPPDFAEIDERARRLMIEEILDAMAEGPEAAAVEAVARHHTGESLADLADEVAARRQLFTAAKDRAAWWAAFGLPPDYDEATLLAEVFRGHERTYVDAILPWLDPQARNEKGARAALSAVGPIAPPRLDDLALFEVAGLTGAKATAPFSAKTLSSAQPFPKKAIREKLGARLDGWDEFLARVEQGRARRVALLAARRALALQDFALPFLAAYEARKAARGALDFDDLILKAGALLARPDVAAWVLYRLDGGIDHVLVDEAQDTSPAQWEVVRLIAEEFTTGLGAREETPRSLFVVGDPKQSIYSFQGADPSGFGRMAKHFDARLAAVGGRLDRVELPVSFRSAPEILRVVDATFADLEANRGLEGPTEHASAHPDLPGRVDLWPLVTREAKATPPAWDDPVDRVDPAHHDVVLARRIAAEIRRLCDPAGGETIPVRLRDEATGAWRVVRRRPEPGDFLVLVRRRSTLFAEVIRACKAEGLPIAGADRLRLGGELAVKDLAALLSFLATPEDDLSLAAALKSPLFGWDEDRLFRLAHGRDGYLWEALRARRDADPPDPRDRETLAVIDDLRAAADFLRPFELIERILTRHHGRQRLLARLGAEAEDGIDALIAQALAYERSEVPSLTGFLGWMETEDVEVKRQLSTATGVVRVMTVHGAKGLEAPVVILPVTRPPRDKGSRSAILAGGEAGALWWPKDQDADPKAAALAAEAARRREEEEQRLLYVALTRAECWLIVAGAGDVGKPDDAGARGWHGMVARAMERVGAVAADTPCGPGRRLCDEARWRGLPEVPPPAREDAPAGLPQWAQVAPPPAAEPLAPISPSDLGGPKALPGEAGALDEADVFDEAAALARGTRLHLLFEHLPAHPPADRPALARRLLAATGASPAEAEALAAEAARILEDPAFAEVFAPGSLAEVPFAAALPELGGRMVAGSIDRLAVSPERVLFADFKTNARVPAQPEEVPEGILRQMAAYAACLARIYPGRRVEGAILWTAAPSLMRLPAGLLTAALARATPP